MEIPDRRLTMSDVSIIMAVYNGERTVRTAIESLQSQTLSDWELVIIDDCSTDSTPAILSELAASDPRIRVLRNPRNQGLAASLNTAWKAAGGRFIARMDADDASDPTRLAKQLALLQQRPDVDVLGTAVITRNEKGREVPLYPPAEHETLAGNIYRGAPVVHPSVMMRREVLEELGGYDEKLRRSQDADLWLRAYRRFRFHNLQEPLVYYSVRSRPTLRSLCYGTFVLARSAVRERKLFTRGWYAARYFVAGVLMMTGLLAGWPRK